jgi:site-specific DNA recombinase
MTQAAIYTRISQDREALGLGVERQRAECEALASRLGWTVAATYEDNDTSAYSGKPRKGYRALMAALEQGTIGAVVAWHPDRLHRQPKELEAFIDLLDRRGVAVQTVTDGEYDLTTSRGRRDARITGAGARYESEHKSDRIRLKMDELSDAGQPHAGGNRAFGLRRVLGSDGHPGRPVAYEIVPDEAALIQEAAAAILDDGRSVRSIAADWRARGILSPRGNPWQPGPLRLMLCSAQLAGLRERHVDRDPKLRAARKGETTLSAVNLPAILPRDRWQALRAVLRDPARRTAPSNARVNLLSGFLVCGRCETRLVGRRRDAGLRRYVCPPKTLGGCGRVAIIADRTEAEVVGRVMAVLDSPTMREVQAESGSRNLQPADPLGERAEAEARLAELTGAYAAGEITRPEWQAARGILAARLAALGSQLLNGRPTIQLPANVADAWPTLDLEQRRRILAYAVESVTIGPAVRGRATFDPDRITVAWRV